MSGEAARQTVAGRHLTGRLTERCLGTALVVASCDPPAVAHGLFAGQAAIAVAAVIAWWAAPMVDARPVQTSLRWFHIAARRRTTLLAAASIALAAATGPALWLGACIAGLFLAYLLVTDDWTRSSTAPARDRSWTPPLAAAAAAALVFLGATVPVAATHWARLPAALALAATAACVGLALRGRRDAS